MNPTSPLVSIGIPFYNPGDYIIETLQSVYDQRYRQIELLLYNDGSTDDSVQNVHAWLECKGERFSKVTFIDATENRGVGFACDVLIKKSSGSYFQMLGADDLIYSDKISGQVDFLSAHPEYAMVYGNMDRMRENGSLLGEDYFKHQQFATFVGSDPPSGNIFFPLVLENFIPASSVMVRKPVIEAVGGYDPSLRLEDWDLWLRISKKNQIGGQNSVVGAYRILSTSAMHAPLNKIKVLESLNVALSKHKGMSAAIDAIINDHLYRNTIEMYRLGHISEKWSADLPGFKTGFKPFVYRFLMKLGIKLNQKKKA